MWGRVLRKRRPGSLEETDWPGVHDVQLSTGTNATLKSDRIERFKQQNLKTYIVTFSPRLVIGVYFVIGLLFIPLGATVIAGSADIRSTPVSAYGSEPKCRVASNRSGNNICDIQFDVPRDIPNPSYVFYVITNMHQNLREYVKSRSDFQLKGGTPKKPDDVKDCGTLTFIDSFTSRPTDYFSNESNRFNISEIRNPCGLTANSVFNDTFLLCHDAECSRTIRLNQEGIAWKTDGMHKFRPGQPPHFTPQVNDMLQSEPFHVWMRLSAFSRVEKLHSIVTERIPMGTYTMRINSTYPVHDFKGEKFFYISNTKWFGARNHFLGVVCLAVGVAALVVALVVLGTHVLYPRPPAHFDPNLIRRELIKLSIEYGQTN